MLTNLRRLAPLAFAALLSLAAAPSARPSTHDAVAALLQRQTQEMADAIAAGGKAVWERYLADGLLYTDEAGTVMTKEEMVKQTTGLPPGVSGHIKVTGFKVALHGTVAVASYVDDEEETYHGHQLHCQYRTTETWQKSAAGWRIIAGQVLALRTDPPAVALPARQLDEYVGRYALTPEITAEIRKTADGGLERQQTGRPAEPLKAEAPDVLFVPGKPRYRTILKRDAEGHVVGFAERREAWDLDWKRLQ
jgi:ketosteroid isomerase-like protein